MHERTQERRLFPRYPLALAVELRSKWGARYTGQGRDLSRGGLTVVVRRAVIAQLVQGRATLAAGDEFQVGLASAPPGATEIRLGAVCRVSHVRRLSQEDYLIGVRFAELSAAQQMALNALLERVRPPRSA